MSVSALQRGHPPATARQGWRDRGQGSSRRCHRHGHSFQWEGPWKLCRSLHSRTGVAGRAGTGVGSRRPPPPSFLALTPRALCLCCAGAAADRTRSPWKRNRPCSLPWSCGPLVCLSPSGSSAEKAPVSVRPARALCPRLEQRREAPRGSPAGGPARPRDPRDAGLSATLTEAAEEGSLWRLAAELPTSWP